MRELAYLNGLDDGATVAPPVATVIASPVVRGRSRGRGVAVRGGHVVRSSVNVIPRPAVVATVATPRHASTAESYVSSDCKTCEFFNKI
jgi:hypothetical protein